MNRSELVRAVAERAGSDEAAARRHVDAVVETVMERVSAGERVIVTGFGTFDRMSRAARSARNPRTGLPVEVPAAEVPRFRVGQTFRNRVAANGTAAGTAAEEAPEAPESPVGVVVEPSRPKKPKGGKKTKGEKKSSGAGKAEKRPGKAEKRPANTEKRPAKAEKRPANAKAGKRTGKAAKKGRVKGGK